MKPPTQALQEPVNHSTKQTGPLIPSNLSTTSALPTTPRRGLGQECGPKATNRTLLTWMLWFSLWCPLQVREVWLGTDLWFEGARTALLPWRPVTHQVGIKPSFVPTTPCSTQEGGFSLSDLLQLCPTLSAFRYLPLGAPQSFQTQFLKIHAPPP